MPVNDLTGLKIKNTYPRLVQIVSGSLYDGVGIPIAVTSSIDTSNLVLYSGSTGNVDLGPYAITGSAITSPAGAGGTIIATNDYADAAAANAAAAEVASIMSIFQQGKYVPSSSIITNVDAVTEYYNRYQQIVQSIIVHGKIDVTSHSTGSISKINFDIPIITVITEQQQLAGTAVCGSTGQTAALYFDTGSEGGDQLIMEWKPISTGMQTMFYTYVYQLK